MGGRLRWLLLLVATVAACLVVLATKGDDDERGAASASLGEVAIGGLHPDFDPGESHYVARCGPEDPPLEVTTGPGVELAVGSGPFNEGPLSFRPDVALGDDFRISVSAGGQTRAYSVRCLPAGFPEWEFESKQPIADELFVVTLSATRSSPHWVIAFDTRGVPRWWYRPDTAVLWAQILDDGTVTWPRAFGDGYGQSRRMAHEVRTLSGKLVRLVRTRGSIIDGHEFRESGGGRVLVTTYVPQRADLRGVGGPRRGAIVAAGVQELDRTGRVTWRWNSRGRITLDETRLRWWARVLANPRKRLGGLKTFDPVHINAIDIRGDDEVVISARHTDGVYGISRGDGRILWKLGGRGTEESLRVVGDPAGRQLFGGQHDVRVADDGTLSVFDNGKLRKYDSRVAFYRLEPGRGRAVYLGHLDDPLVRKSQCCGSARELAGGGWLVSWGKNRVITGFDEQRRIAFRLRLPAHTYRAVPVPPGAVTVPELDRALERMAGQHDDLSDGDAGD